MVPLIVTAAGARKGFLYRNAVDVVERAVESSTAVPVAADAPDRGRNTMVTPPRLLPLLEQFDFARKRLTDRLTGPQMDSGDGASIEAGMSDDEYLWEPAQNCWSIRPRAAGPGPARPCSFVPGTGAATVVARILGHRRSPPSPGDSAISARC